MASIPTDITLDAIIDVACARCNHPTAAIRVKLPLIGTSFDREGKLLPVIDVRAGVASFELECQGCHQVIRWRNVELGHDFPADAYPQDDVPRMERASSDDFRRMREREREEASGGE